MAENDVIDILRSSHATIIQPYSGRIYKYESLNDANITFDTWKNNNPKQVERRKELLKVAAQIAENSKIAIRNIRRDIIEDIRKSHKNNEISDDERYGNFEIAVPEITKEVYDNANITAYIQRTYEDDRPDRWSQLPQVFLNSDNSTSAYLSFGEGFIRISFQSEESIDELFELFSGRVLKLVIVN